MENEDKFYKGSLTSVLLGYSVCTYKDEKVFIKHFGYTDSIETDYHYDLVLKRSIERGIPTEKEKLQGLIDNKLWSEEKEKEIASLAQVIDILDKARIKATLPSQAEEKSKQILIRQFERASLLNMRYRLLSLTAESMAQKRSEDFYIYSSFFKNKKLSKKLIEEDFDDVDSDTLVELRDLYYSSMSNILGGKIKRLALQAEMQYLIGMSENSYEIFGKPFVDYSFFQTDLVLYSKFYKRVLTCESPPPDSIKKNPEKIEEWWDNIQKGKKIMERSKKSNIEGGGQLVFGATPKDMSILGNGANVVSLDSEIKKGSKDGAPLGMQQMMKIFG